MNEDALKDRLKVIAKTKGVTFNETWKHLVLERFLARLSRSAHHEHFIFKGGLLLAQRILIGRETTDIDFLMTQLKNETPTIEAALRAIAGIDANDGFRYEWNSIKELAQPHMEYAGFRVTLDVAHGNMKDKVHVDIGVGDQVEPIEDRFRPSEYKGTPIFEGEIALLTYPVETIFAEKLETIVSKGATNSRMKDYHDVALMIREKGFLDVAASRAALLATFNHRGTAFRPPIAFDETGIESLQRLWKNHLTGLGMFQEKLNLPDTIEAVIAEINAWLSANGIRGLS